MNRGVSDIRNSESTRLAFLRQGRAKHLAHSLVLFLLAAAMLGMSAVHAAKPLAKPDNAAPTVSITAPTAGSTVAGVVAVNVTATDNVGVTKVDFTVNGTLQAGDTSAPYSFSWDSTKVANGSVTLSATAYDAAGNRATASATVNVVNNTQPPSVAITSPTAGSTVTGTVAVAVSAASAKGISRVDLKANGTLVASDTSSPYTFSWDTTKVADGSIILSAAAYDTSGMSATTSVNETVANTTVTQASASGTVTLSVASVNPTSGAAVSVYPSDTSGLGDGTSSLTRTYGANERVWLSAALHAGSSYFVKWQKDGVDYDTASTTSVVMDANHTFTAVYAVPNCVGVAVYPGTDSIRNAVAANPAGTTFCIKAGTHRMTSAITARTGDKYIGETGAILNGSKIVTSFAQSGSYWIATGQTQQEPPWPATVGGWAVCVPTATACIYPERVFIDGKDLFQVASLAELAPGKFYFDYASNYIYLLDNPTGHTVEATTGTGGLIGNADGSSNSVTVQNLIFEKFGGGVVTGYSHNALKAVDGWLVVNNEFRYISTMAVANFGNGIIRNNYIHHNGQYGVVGLSVFEGNVISYNNTDGFNTGTDAGASKFHGTKGLVLRGNIVANNNSRGFWADFDNINVTYENNIIKNNTQMGILHEASCAAVVKNNVLSGNNGLFAGKAIWYGAQIFARASKDMQIYGNDVTASPPGQNGIGLYTEWVNGGPRTYTGTNCGTIDLQNITVHDNVVRIDTGQQNGVASGLAGTAAAYGISFSHNKYYLRSLLGNYLQYDGVLRTKDQWQAVGQDTTGSFLQY